MTIQRLSRICGAVTLASLLGGISISLYYLDTWYRTESVKRHLFKKFPVLSQHVNLVPDRYQPIYIKALVKQKTPVPVSRHMTNQYRDPFADPDIHPAPPKVLPRTLQQALSELDFDQWCFKPRESFLLCDICYGKDETNSICAFMTVPYSLFHYSLISIPAFILLLLLYGLKSVTGNGIWNRTFLTALGAMLAFFIFFHSSHYQVPAFSTIAIYHSNLDLCNIGLTACVLCSQLMLHLFTRRLTGRP